MLLEDSSLLIENGLALRCNAATAAAAAFGPLPYLTHFIAALRSHSCTRMFNAALWAAHLLEKPGEPLEVIVQPDDHTKVICQNPALAALAQRQ